jgi:hypothetical protein
VRHEKLCIDPCLETQKLQCTVAPLKLNFLIWKRISENNTPSNYFNDLSTDVNINGAVNVSVCVHRRKANHYAPTTGISMFACLEAVIL